MEFDPNPTEPGLRLAKLGEKVDKLEAELAMVRGELARWKDRLRVALEDLDALHIKVYGKGHD